MKKLQKSQSQTKFNFEEQNPVSQSVSSATVSQQDTSVSIANTLSTENAQEKSLSRKALHYGEAKFLDNIVCDVYILDDGSTVMSETGFAALLGVRHYTLQSMANNWPPKTMETFCDKGLTMRTTLAKVEAQNCSYQGREIVVYDTAVID